MSVDIERIKVLYARGRLTDEELTEYSNLRIEEYQERKQELTLLGATNIKVVKGSDNDIVGWTFETVPIIEG